ncbi:protein kinase domain-containing protein [Streptomyces ziwulingensis]|uniref:Protein kinase domain-containing protein n=1 Tax=Streptomyces ziwulingensis TaxID=1045501 RepID=A0ABP9CF11_9ACTN
MRDDVLLSVPKGYRVGRWEVGDPLASGASATVYAGRLVGSGPAGLPRRAALKFLPTGARSPHRARELACREIELLGRLRSPRLIRMYETLTVDAPEVPELDGATVLVLERAEGSLDAVAPAGPAASAALAQICEGLAQLHRAGWVHGDLKPANVLLMSDGSVRLADFGGAAEMEGAHACTSTFATPDYTPPELLWPEVDERGARTRPAADVWAFGVLAHVLLTGTFPLPGETEEARCDAAVRYARGAAELRLSPALPDAWRGIVRDCLAPAHTDRAGTQALTRRTAEAVGDGSGGGGGKGSGYGAGGGSGYGAGGRGGGGRSPRRPGSRAVLTGAFAAVLLGAVGMGAAPYLADRAGPAGDGRAATRTVPGGPDASARDAPARDAPVQDASAQGYHRCPADSVCLFSEHDGHGHMCSWPRRDPDRRAGTRTCAWTARHPVRSVFSNVADARNLAGPARPRTAVLSGRSAASP